MSETLPKGWIYTILGNISTHPQYGWTCSSKSNGKLKLLRTTDISDGNINWASVPFCAKEPDDEEKYLLKDNDILVSRAGSVGVSYRITKNDLFHRTVFASYLIRFCPFIPASFVEHYFKSHQYWQFISDSQLGIAVPNVNATKLSELPFPLPPLNEQKRIVARLDKIMPRIAAVKKRLDKVSAIVKRFRQSVLTAAVTGKLTEKWRVSKDLPEWTKNSFNSFDLPNIPECWNWVLISDLVLKEKNSLKAGPFGSSLKKEVYVKEGYKIYGQEQVINNDAFYGNYYVNEIKYKELESCKVKPNDVLISLVGTVGKVLILPENCQKGIINPRLVKISFDLNIYRPKFFKFYFSSHVLKSFYGELIHGSTMDVLNLSIIKSLPFPLPPLEEQKEIVRQVEKLFVLADRLESHYQKAKAGVDKLSQSVLAKAFRGELVITEAELAEKDGRAFESAEKLLERILAEKAKLAKGKATKKASVASTTLNHRVSGLCSATRIFNRSLSAVTERSRGRAETTAIEE